MKSIKKILTSLILCGAAFSACAQSSVFAHWTSYGNPNFYTLNNAGDDSLVFTSAGQAYEATSTFGGGISIMTAENTKSGLTWVSVGTPISGSIQTTSSSIAVDNTSTPYVAYYDFNSENLFVEKYNGSAWVQVGNAFTNLTVSALSDQDYSFAISPSGVPYIAYVNNKQSGHKIEVEMFNGTAWIPVGKDNYTSVNEPWSIALSVSSGTPYLAYSGYHGISVVTFNGTTWKLVGKPDFNTSTDARLTLAVNAQGIPYVAFSDMMASRYLSVYEYDQRWKPAGNTGFMNVTNMQHPGGQLVISSTGQLYASSNWNITGVPVMTLLNNKWIPAGNINFDPTDANAGHLSLAINPQNNNPYLLFVNKNLERNVVTLG